MLPAFGKAVDNLGGHYVTAEDVGMSVADMIEDRATRPFVAGCRSRAAKSAAIPGPHTSLGVFLGIKAAVRRALGKDSLTGLHIALQGAGSVAAVLRCSRAEGARLSIADVEAKGAEAGRRDRWQGRRDR